MQNSNQKTISHVGVFTIPENNTQLETNYPLDNKNEPLREGLDYKLFNRIDTTYIYLAKVNNEVGHVFVQNSHADWDDSTFCVLENGSPVIN